MKMRSAAEMLHNDEVDMREPPNKQARVTCEETLARELKMAELGPGRTKRSFCTKTRSCLRDGGDPAITKRLLKTWAVWGYDKDSKDSHAEVWPEVLEAHEAGDLPTDEALEEQVIHDWSELGMSEKSLES